MDPVGLTSPKIMAVTANSWPGSADRNAQLRNLLLAQGVTHMVTFPEWFPHLAADSALVEVARFAVLRAGALAYEQMVIYRPGMP